MNTGIEKSTIEFEALVGLTQRQTIEWAFPGDCLRCGEHRTFCWVIDNKDSGERETWCLGCIAMTHLRAVKYKAGSPLTVAPPLEAPASPWGSTS